MGGPSSAGGRWFPLIPLGLGGLLFLGALGVATVPTFEQRSREARRHWVPVEAVSVQGTGLADTRRTEEPVEREFQAVTTIAWVVGGKPYSSTLSEYAGWTGAQSEPARRLAPGDTLALLVDPADPSQWVLAPTGPPAAPPSGLVFSGVAAALLLLALPFLLFGARGLARNLRAT